tara:strand:+ start:71 stop:889 length:819 start_codon:yes stop_codon:yes gene_type:complete
MSIHVVILTCPKYKRHLPAVLKGLELIEDTISGITIISPEPVEVAGCVNLLDRDLWEIIDPTFKHQRLWDNVWYRQQIFKLYLDQFIITECDNILIVDGDVIITAPIRFMEKDHTNFYTIPFFKDDQISYYRGVYELTGLKRNTPFSFIAEVMIFNKTILKELRHYVETHTGHTFLESIDTALDESLTIPDPILAETKLSEYELYGTFVFAKHRDMVNKLIEPNPAQLREQVLGIDVRGWQNLNAEDLYSFICTKSTHVFQSVRLISASKIH